MKDRSDIRDFVLSLERQYPVNDWQVDGLHLWPYIRIRLFFFLIRALEQNGKGNMPLPKASAVGKARKSLSEIKSWPAGRKFYKQWMDSLSSKKYLFTDTDAHRVWHNGKRFDRYFDVLIDDYGIAGESVCFDLDATASGSRYRPEMTLRFQPALKFYLSRYGFAKNHRVRVAGLSDFLRDVERKEASAKGFASANPAESLVSYHKSLSVAADFFGLCLARVNPEKVLSLNYYGDPDIMALIAAANRKGIETVEMQHGPMSSIHLGYGSWENMPETGYDIMPRRFWCWDEDSVRETKTWTRKTALYDVVLAGNPWIEYWKKQPSAYPERGFVLYTLQPEPVTLEQLFPESVVRLISGSDKPWYLRLHPRQVSQRGELESRLSSLGILGRVVIDAATQDPLPLLLQHAALHVTRFSGTAIEAAFFGCFSVLLDPIAKVNFAGLIDAGKATYLNLDNPDFIDTFKALQAREKAGAPLTQEPNTAELF